MSRLITGAAFGALFTSFSRTARRLETRDHYRIPEEDEQTRRFAAGQLTEAEQRQYMAGWMAMVRQVTDAGKSFGRVRVVPKPLTPYLRQELWTNRLNAEAGEDIRYLDRDQANRLDLPAHDFWLFDDERLALQCFSADDRPLGALLVTEPDVVAQHRAWIDTAWEAATPYRDFLAADPSRERPA